MITCICVDVQPCKLMHFLHGRGGCIISLRADEDKRTFSASNDTGNITRMSAASDCLADDASVLLHGNGSIKNRNGIAASNDPRGDVWWNISGRGLMMMEQRADKRKVNK